MTVSQLKWVFWQKSWFVERASGARSAMKKPFANPNQTGLAHESTLGPGRWSEYFDKRKSVFGGRGEYFDKRKWVFWQKKVSILTKIFFRKSLVINWKLSIFSDVADSHIYSRYIQHTHARARDNVCFEKQRQKLATPIIRPASNNPPQFQDHR
jgi:hypothetical protein